MLNLFAVVSKGGEVLWQRALDAQSEAELGASAVSQVIREALLEQQLASSTMPLRGDYTAHWCLANDADLAPGLLFVAIHLTMARLPWLAEFLSAARAAFCKRLRRVRRSLQRGAVASGLFRVDFDADYDALLARFETAASSSKSASSLSSAPKSLSAQDEESTGEAVPDFGEFMSTRERLRMQAQNRTKPKRDGKADSKKTRDWGIDGKFDSEMAQQLDRSAGPRRSSSDDDWRKREYGKVDLVDSDDETEGELESDKPSSSWLSMFGKLAGHTGTLKASDLETALQALQEKLASNNVAREIAEELCESVRQNLVGQRVGRFATLKGTVRDAVAKALERVLTPHHSVDVLGGIAQARREKRPYTIVFIGVNGVGKSTSLSKVAAYLSQRNLRVSMAACDTFRSGAVEQLKTHARALRIRVFDQGYASEPTKVAAAAISEARRLQDDVVLIDTAGRMVNNEPLMRALSKLIVSNRPDLVLFVGEALVGNDALQQLTMFNASLADLAPPNSPARQVDGIVLSKYDTVDDRVGAAVNMSRTARRPIVFVGTGQDYGDIRRMNVREMVRRLLR